MISITLVQLADILKGEIFGEDVSFDDIVTDTRKVVRRNFLFIALKGNNFDAHDLIHQITLTEVKALLVERKLNIDLPQLVVSNTRLALCKLAMWIRQRMSTRIVALTGSAGKTTVKEMVASILTRHGKTLYTIGNMNNDIGVSMTLLRLTKEYKYAVIELGANNYGEISWTTSLVQPEVALVNNIAESHLENFGSLQGVAQAKGEIYEGLLKNGIAIINEDNNDWTNWQHIIGSRKVWRFSFNKTINSDFFAKNIQETLHGIKFTLQTPNGDTNISLPLLGSHSVSNALAAAAITMAVDIPLEIVKIGLNNIKAIPGRLFPIYLNKNQLLLDDSYNANIGSLIVAVKLLSKMPGYKIIVIGDISELGRKSEIYHTKIGKIIKCYGIDHTLSIGNLSKNISDASNYGEHFFCKSELISYLNILLDKHPVTTILVKGSRGAAMEEVVRSLQESRKCSFG